MSIKKQTFRTTAQKDFAGVFAELCYNKHTWQAWADFVEAAAIALHNACDRTSIKYGEREARYRQIMNGYSPKEQAVFPKLFAMFCAALEQNPEQDFLGDMFMRLELGSHWHGQFFTPYNVCQMMAEMQMQDIKTQIQERGWVSIHDCACGAGATLIAARNVIVRQKLDWSSQAFFVGQDIDRTAALMCYLQLSLLGCAGYVVIADSLRYPITGSLLRPARVPQQDIWYMPALFFSTAWGYRMLWEQVERMTGTRSQDK